MIFFRAYIKYVCMYTYHMYSAIIFSLDSVRFKFMRSERRAMFGRLLWSLCAFEVWHRGRRETESVCVKERGDVGEIKYRSRRGRWRVNIGVQRGNVFGFLAVQCFRCWRIGILSIPIDSSSSFFFWANRFLFYLANSN